MGKKKIIILGGGLSGLSAAWHLQRRGADCKIFEKEPEAGGLCRSKKVNGFTFDHDGHLLHFRHPYTFNLVKNILGDNIAEHQRNSWIYTDHRYNHFPFQANLYGLPSAVVKDCLLGFIDSRRNHTTHPKNENFLHWINSTFGKGIARHFMIPYNSKFWTVPPEKLTCEWLEGFIPIPSLSQLIEGTIQEGKGNLGYNARFWYPKKGGIAELSHGLSRQINNLYTDSPAISINLKKKEVYTKKTGKEKFDLLISTIALPELAKLTVDIPAQQKLLFRKLRHNSILNINLGINRQDASKRHWIYFPESNLSFFRAGFYHNFSSDLVPNGKSSLYAEVSYSKDKPINKTTIVSQVIKDLKKTGILLTGDKLLAQDTNDIPYGYPIYDQNYRQTRDKIMEALNSHDIIPCGRYGNWQYMSMEDALLDGKKAAEKIKA